MGKLLLIVTGSVAAIKLHHMVAALVSQPGMEVRVVLTPISSRFFSESTLDSIGKLVKVYTDSNEQWDKIGDPVLHIDLRNWADHILVAPLSANSLSQISSGGCNNLAMTIIRASLPNATRAMWAAPAMNKDMYSHPVTAIQLDLLKKWGWKILDPADKVLACGEQGVGAMMEWAEIVDLVITHHGQFTQRNQGHVNTQTQYCSVG